MADRRDTYAKVRRWLLEAADEAVHIGFQLQCETTVEVTAWAQTTNFLEEGVLRSTMARVTDMATQNVVNDAMTTGVETEIKRLAEIAHYKRMAKDYKERLVS